jgi:DNA uptake protein ComE-like DNA-binding protein
MQQITMMSPDGQPVAVMSVMTDDFLRAGYRFPRQVEEISGEISSPAILQIVKDKEPLNLMTATLAELVALPGVGTAKAKKVKELAESNKLSLDALQEIGGVDWTDLYQSGVIVWPGGLHVVE